MNGSNWKVCKFGGSSLADAEQIRKSADIMLQDPLRRIMVVSAPGKRTPHDSKITDQLIELAQAIQGGYEFTSIVERIASRYAGIAADLGLHEDFAELVRTYLNERVGQVSALNSRQFSDLLMASGEDMCARLVSAYIRSIGHEVRYVNPMEAGLTLQYVKGGRVQVHNSSYGKLSELTRTRELIIFPGFFGADEGGKVAVFSRGGSDITGSILAAAVGAQVYENWTDVDSVFSTDPKIIPHPHAIKEMTYTEMRELAYAGFTVLHEEALEPVYHNDIPLQIRNTNNPYGAGTRIMSKRTDYDGIITGIAGSKGFVAIRLQKYLMNREVGFAAAALNVMQEFELPVEHIPTGIDSLSVVLRERVFSEAVERQVTARLKDILDLDDDEITIQRGIAMVSIVGDALPRTVGLLARALVALSEGGINLEFIVQAAGEISVLFGIEEEFCSYAIQLLYKCYFSHYQE